jgi:hypothetical protein
VFAVVRSSSLVEWSYPAAHRATYGGVLSVTYPRLSPRREMAVVCAVYSPAETREIAAVWIGCGERFSPLPIPRGETQAAFPAEPTRARVRAGKAGQCRPQAARKAGCIDGRVIWRATLA